MNIIYATDSYWPRISGMGVSIDAFKSELDKKGHCVSIFAPNYPDAREDDRELDRKNIHRFRSYGLFFSEGDRLVYPFEKGKVERILDSLRPDIIHVQTEFTMGRLVWEYALKYRIPLVMTAHTNWEALVNLYLPFLPHALARLYGRNRLRHTYNKADFVIVPTSLMKELLLSYKVTKPMEIIPTGIVKSDFEGVKRDREKKHSSIFREHPELKGKKILLAAGRVGKEKNLPFLIDVAKKLMQEFPDLYMIIVGDGPYRKEIQRIVHQKGADRNIIMTGFIEKNRMKELYALADIFIFASKVESQGLVTIEAMICGTPVVAIGEMGTREVMNGDNGGFMVEDNLELFTEKIRLLLTDKVLYRSKSEEARRYAEGWTIEKNAQKMLEIYEYLCTGR
jgi:hypothetical protein